MTTKNEFMRKMDQVDRNGPIHKAKLASLVYDLVMEKSQPQPLEEKSDKEYDDLYSKVVELSARVEELIEINTVLDTKVTDLEDKLVKTSKSNTTEKAATKKSETKIKLKGNK